MMMASPWKTHNWDSFSHHAVRSPSPMGIAMGTVNQSPAPPHCSNSGQEENPARCSLQKTAAQPASELSSSERSEPGDGTCGRCYSKMDLVAWNREVSVALVTILSSFSSVRVIHLSVGTFPASKTLRETLNIPTSGQGLVALRNLIVLMF